MYVSVWQVMPVMDPDCEYPGIFVGYGLIDGVADGTNISIQPLKETDSYYPFFPGTVRRYVEQSGYPIGAVAKDCGGFMLDKGCASSGRAFKNIPCGRPISRLTSPYSNMTCNRCYPYVQKQDDNALEAEKEMIANHNDPGRQYRD
jgi:hypothetical protein